MLAKFISADLISKYTPDVFIKYFEDQFNQKFKHELIINDGSMDSGGMGPSTAGFASKYSTIDNKIVFEFNVYVFLSSVMHNNDNKTLSNNPDVSYTITSTAFGYSNRKKQKMSQRDWKQVQNHSFLYDPKKSFSLAKMKKMSSATPTVEMKRADFRLAVKNELKVKNWNTDTYLVPLKDGTFFQITRSVFMRTPLWSVDRFGELASKYTFNTTEYINISLPETTDTLDLFLKMQKMSTKDAIKLIKDEKEKLRKKYA